MLKIRSIHSGPPIAFSLPAGAFADFMFFLSPSNRRDEKSWWKQFRGRQALKVLCANVERKDWSDIHDGTSQGFPWRSSLSARSVVTMSRRVPVIRDG